MANLPTSCNTPTGEDATLRRTLQSPASVPTPNWAAAKRRHNKGVSLATELGEFLALTRHRLARDPIGSYKLATATHRAYAARLVRNTHPGKAPRGCETGTPACRGPCKGGTQKPFRKPPAISLYTQISPPASLPFAVPALSARGLFFLYLAHAGPFPVHVNRRLTRPPKDSRPVSTTIAIDSWRQKIGFGDGVRGLDLRWRGQEGAQRCTRTPPPNPFPKQCMQHPISQNPFAQHGLQQTIS